MLGNIFYWVFNMSIAASIAGAVIVALRQIKKLPKRLVHLLWMIPFLRAVVPFGISGKYGLMSLFSKFATKTVVVYELREEPLVTTMNFLQSAKSYFPIEYKSNVLEKLFDTASLIWLCGVVALVIAFFAIYFTTLHELSASEHFRDNIYFSKKVDVPAVYGILKPKIILPICAKKMDTKYILMHEKAHIRRGDNLFRILGFLVVFLHWFNPLSWVFLKLFLADCELACDESVLKSCGKDEKKLYASALLDFKENATVFASAFGGAKVRTRIENILSYKKMSVFSLICFVILWCAIFYFLLTNAM
jgi:beta-lactamase regulating signal transducer with metallopeptidase domain